MVKSFLVVLFQCIFHRFAFGNDLPSATALRDKGMITEIDEQSKLYTGQIPQDWHTLTSLTSIRLDNNLLTGGLDPLFQLTNLEHLSLRGNFFSGSVEGLDALNRLTHLDLSYNNFTGTLSPITISFPDLHTIYLDGNHWSCPLPNSYLIDVNDYFEANAQCSHHSNRSFSCDAEFSLSPGTPFPQNKTVEVPKSATIIDENSRGIQFFVKNPSEGCLFRMGSSSSPWEVRFEKDDEDVTQIRITNVELTNVTFLTDGQWHHVLISFNSQNPPLPLLEIYIDDILELSHAEKHLFQTGANGPDDLNYVGLCPGGIGLWYGELHSFHLYECAASEGIPTLEPTQTPSANPTVEPTFNPTVEPIYNPTGEPSASPTLNPFEPTVNPTYEPTCYPSVEPTYNPTINPTFQPTFEPTVSPSTDPSRKPSSSFPSKSPFTSSPSTSFPSTDPSMSLPSCVPSVAPSSLPSKNPATTKPSRIPTTSPSSFPSTSPHTSKPTPKPSKIPTTAPTASPTKSPTTTPSRIPTTDPTVKPTKFPVTALPTRPPTTDKPTASPSASSPSCSPTLRPSKNPFTTRPSRQPSSDMPSSSPSGSPTFKPSFEPSFQPSVAPSFEPSTAPIHVEQLHLEGDYDALFSKESERARFLEDCSSEFESRRVICSDVSKGSILVDLKGSAENLQYYMESFTEGSLFELNNGDWGPFTILPPIEDVGKTEDDSSTIAGMSPAVFFILITLIIVIIVLSLFLFKLVFGFEFGSFNGGGKTGPSLSPNTDPELGNESEIQLTEKRTPRSSATKPGIGLDQELPALPSEPGISGDDITGMLNDEEILESQIGDLQSLLQQRHILDPHKVFELEEELGGLKALLTFIRSESERL